MKEPSAKKHIYLIGYMGTGKTTIGQLLSDKTGLEYLDTDELISEQFGMSIKSIFDVYGEEDFRDAETDVLADISHALDGLIVSCGGGIPLREENRNILKESGTVVLLTAEPEEILKRISCDDTRPLFENKKSISDISKMLNTRQAAYNEAADIVIDTNGKTPEEIAGEIIAACASF